MLKLRCVLTDCMDYLVLYSYSKIVHVFISVLSLTYGYRLQL